MHSIYVYTCTDIYQGLKIFANNCMYIYIYWCNIKQFIVSLFQNTYETKVVHDNVHKPVVCVCVTTACLNHIIYLMNNMPITMA